MANARVIRGKGLQGSKVLVDNNYKYHYNNRSNTRLYWRCWRKNCRSPLRTNVFNMNNPAAVIQIIFNGNAHNHPQEARLIDETAAVNSMKDDLVQNPTRPIKRVYNEHLSRAYQNAGAAGIPPPSIPEFHEIRSSLARMKAQQCPPVPRNINQVNIVGPFAQTHLGERFLLYINNNIGIAIFATDIELNSLAGCVTIYVDRTFQTAPAPYKQVFTVHGEVHDRILNLASALLTGKTQQHYDLLFQNLIIEMRRVRPNNPINVRLVVTDFETAVITSVQNAFPGIQVGGCYFHFVQSLWRHVQTLGLSVAYNNNNLLHTFLNRCFALGFLPPPDVINSFSTLIRARITQQLIQQYPNLQTFITYVWNTYLVGIFPIHVWNVFGRGMSTRTNNCVESYHSQWNEIVGVRHPSVWILIRKMQDQQALTRNSLIRANNGHQPVTRRRKWRVLEGSINRKKARLLNGQWNVLQYWSAVSNLMSSIR